MNATAPPSDERAFTSAATAAYEEEALAWVSYDLNHMPQQTFSCLSAIHLEGHQGREGATC